jgi:hypothetical protein
LARGTIVAVLVVVVIGAAAAPWWLSNPERLSGIVANLLPELDATVSFERVRLGWMGPIVLEGVKVVPADGREPPVFIRRIEGDHGLLTMLLSGGDLGRFVIEDPTIQLAFDQDHGTNLEQLFRTSDAPPIVERLPQRRRAAVSVRIDVEDAIVRITAPWTVETWVSDPITIHASLAPTGDGFSEWTIDPVHLLADARMDPPVASGVLAYIAPVLADAARTSGRFSLSLDRARLPVGDPGGGTLSGTLSMHEVVVGPGPLVADLIESLPAGFPRPTSIRIADESHVKFRLADRLVSHEGLEFGVPLPNGRRLDVQSSGTVGIDDRGLDLKLMLPIPADLPQDRPVVAALAGKTISLGVAGTLDEPRVVFDGSIRQAAEQFALDLLERVPEILERVRGERPVIPASATEVHTDADTDVADDTRQPSISSDDVVDIVGSVIDEVARRRAERRAAEEAGQAPPRRGRLRDRLLRPQAPPAQQTAPE